MANTLVVGMQWGDEGKGKKIDQESEKHDVIVRYQGGGNAGHTVVIEDKKYALHLIPSGILRADKLNIIGHNVVIDPEEFAKEVEGLRSRGVEVSSRNLLVSHRAHMTLLYHKRLDVAREAFKRKKGKQIGTTGRGIGSTYVDKYNREGIRVFKLNNMDELAKKVEENLEITNFLLEHYSDKPLSLDEVMTGLIKNRELLLDFSHNDIGRVILERDGKVLGESAQGTLLDVDEGTYPFVTPSNPTIGGFYTGTGVYINFKKVHGILKAYTTRVGEGPFPTELEDETGERLRQRGHEFGTTTGRPRRCGWQDLAIARYAIRVNGINEISLTKLDVLDAEKSIKVCVGYNINGQKADYFPAEQMENCEPIYESLKGWEQDISGIRSWQDLPKNAKSYVSFIEQFLDVPVKQIGVGARRDQTIDRA